MHSLTICFGPTGTVWTLLYKTEEKAGECYGAYTDAKLNKAYGPLIGSDDFGQAFSLDIDQIHGMLLEDMDLSQMAQVERGLHQARSQAKAQTRAMQDPVIKESLRAQQMGPAVMSPVPGGRFS